MSGRRVRSIGSRSGRWTLPDWLKSVAFNAAALAVIVNLGPVVEWLFVSDRGSWDGFPPHVRLIGDPPLADDPPADAAPGVIGVESRVPIEQLRAMGGIAPDWARVLHATVGIECPHGRATGVVVERRDLVVTAAHLFLRDDGIPRVGSERCWVRPAGRARPRPFQRHDVVLGDYGRPVGLAAFVSVDSVNRDWAVLTLPAPLHAVEPLPLATRREVEKAPLGGRVINVAAFQDVAEDGFAFQLCHQHGAVPFTFDEMDEDHIVRRPVTVEEAARNLRTDCDIDGGGSGSPIVGWRAGGTPILLGTSTSGYVSAGRCRRAGDAYCYATGPSAVALREGVALADRRRADGATPESRRLAAPR